jgi:hypothetical protein
VGLSPCAENSRREIIARKIAARLFGPLDLEIFPLGGTDKKNAAERPTSLLVKLNLIRRLFRPP